VQAVSRDDGFTLTELLISTTITLMVLGGAMATVKQAFTLNDTGTQLADANQNLRAGTNLLIKDLLQAGRGIPVGGISIASGTGSTPINRPAPPGMSFTFDNTTASTLPAIITGSGLGPVVDNQTTDIVTMLMIDPLLPPANLPQGAIADDGSSMFLGATSPWITGNIVGPPADTVAPIKTGDLVWFNSGSNGVIRTITSVDATRAYFETNNSNDWFGFNQTAPQGTLMQLKPGSNPFPAMSVLRLIMLTYYVDSVTTPGTPRLTRVQNHFSSQALAGVVEDLDLTYDLVDGVTNPANVPSLPYTLNGLTYTSNQIRKVNLHVGVRSDLLSAVKNDYIRNHVSTSVSIRDLASVSRYF
jgi:hypothetical protein